MEKAAKEFLEQSGRLYETNKKKWKTLLKDKGLTFNEDIYNDSILKTYEAILKKEVNADYMGYWYTTFLNNTKRQTQYSHTKKKEDIDHFDVLKEKEYEENNLKVYEKSKDIYRQLCDAADRDKEAFTQLSEAYKLPRNTEEEKVEKVEEAKEEATEENNETTE